MVTFNFPFVLKSLHRDSELDWISSWGVVFF
jgi:hypothetical protein